MVVDIHSAERLPSSNDVDCGNIRIQILRATLRLMSDLPSCHLGIALVSTCGEEVTQVDLHMSDRSHVIKLIPHDLLDDGLLTSE